MSAPDFLYNSRITAVRFNLSGTETVIKDSVAVITSHDAFKNAQPYPGGIYDTHLGTNSHAYRCHTCFNNKENCTGHEGSIVLNYPVWNPIAVPEGKKWLRVLCHTCGELIFHDHELSKYSVQARLTELSKAGRTTKRKCPHCQAVQPTIKKNDKQPLLIRLESPADTPKYLYPHQCESIFARVSDDTIAKMGRTPASSPSHFVLRQIKVPGVNVRPDVKKMQGGHATNDSLTTLLVAFIKKNSSLPEVIPDVIDDDKLGKSYMDLNNAYNDFVKAGGETGTASIAARFKGKGGRFRKNQLGKRIRVSCRSVIAGDSNLKLNQVGVPLSFATTIQIREFVQAFNKTRLLTYVQNGQSKKYPGASAIIKRDGRKIIVAIANEIDLELENGDEVYRDMIDGDYVNFNRAPSLTISNISAMEVRVNLDPRVKVLAFNVLVTPFFNADFDGDCMTLYVSNSENTMFEISELASPDNWFVSHATASPFIGQKEDSIMGAAELTRDRVVLDKYHALLLFNNIDELPDFSNVTTITGRACMSELLRNTPINFTRGTSWFGDGQMANVIKYSPTEVKLVIDQGVITQGILDKKSIGKDASGAIYHLIASDYGAKKALEVMFTMQQMAIAYVLQYGYTVGILDMIIPLKCKRIIDDINSDIINRSQLITEQLYRGDIIPPIGKTVEEYYEEQQQEVLIVTDEFRDPVLQAIDPENNNLFKMNGYGSKGSFNNILNMVSSAGQKLINGFRAKPNFGFKRTLPYFKRFSAEPEARGFVVNSYLAGINSVEYFFTAAACRFDLISKAIMTAVTGEQGRKSIKSLESIIINMFRSAMKHRNIVSLVYGEDMYDPRKLERVRFHTVMISDAEFNKYKHDEFVDYFERMQHDRDTYRRAFLEIEAMNVRETITDERKVGVDVGRIITDILRSGILPTSTDTSPASTSTLAELVSIVEEFIAGFPYLLMNSAKAKAKAPIPAHLSKAVWLMQMLIRIHLCPHALRDRGITKPILTMIIDKIRYKYNMSLIEPGTAAGIISAMSFCEPLTQYMLDAHTRSSVGGTSKSNVRLCKEVLGAKSVDKLLMPTMLISLHPSIVPTEARAQEIANKIEVMEFGRFVEAPGAYLFVEKFKEPVHSEHVKDRALITEFIRLNPLLKPPGDLTFWCIKFVLDRSALILKNMPLETIINAVREAYPDSYVVYSPENSSEIIIRIYFRSIMFRGTPTLREIKELASEIIKLNVRGVVGITNATAVQMIRSKINPDGSITRDDSRWGISTTGTNMIGVLGIPEIDPRLVLTTAIQEVDAVCGIEAARNKIISEMKSIGLSIDPRHYMTYADEMTSSGKVTPIENTGLKSREANNVLLRTGFSSPMTALTEAAIYNTREEIYGVTSPLLLGATPKFGTMYNECFVNVDFVRANTKSVEQYLEALL